MKFRCCKVVQAGANQSSAARDAWVPAERASIGAVVSLEFPMCDAMDFTIVECGAQVIDGALRAYL